MYKIIFSLILICCVSAFDITNKITVSRVYDGDTFYVNIEGYPPIIGSNIGIRVNGLDTPELRTRNKYEKQLGYVAKDLAVSLLMGTNRITFKNTQRGKYFRIVADVYINDENYADILIASNLAYSYDGGTKKSWFTIIKEKWSNIFK